MTFITKAEALKQLLKKEKSRTHYADYMQSCPLSEKEFIELLDNGSSKSFNLIFKHCSYDFDKQSQNDKKEDIKLLIELDYIKESEKDRFYLEMNKI